MGFGKLGRFLSEECDNLILFMCDLEISEMGFSFIDVQAVI